METHAGQDHAEQIKTENIFTCFWIWNQELKSKTRNLGHFKRRFFDPLSFAIWNSKKPLILALMNAESIKNCNFRIEKQKKGITRYGLFPLSKHWPTGSPRFVQLWFLLGSLNRSRISRAFLSVWLYTCWKNGYTE